MLYTILQIIAFQALFLLIYDLFLKRETFFNYNRAYLLITALLSFCLPFIKLPQLKQMATKDVVIQLPEVFIGVSSPTEMDILVAEQAGIILEQPQTPVWKIIVFVGIIFTTLIFLIKMAKLYWLKQQNPKRWKGNVLIVKLIKSSAAFSFFNTIFLGEHISETEKPVIYKHELVHIKELHTLDLLFFEFLRILFWFNPLVYMYQNRIKDLHEYIADAKSIKQNGKVDYYQSLLNQVFDVNNVSFINTFFKKSLIKKRIAMLQKSKSKQLHLIKYTLLIPMVFAMLIYTSTEVKAQEKLESQSSVVTQEITDEEIIQKYLKELIEKSKIEESFMDVRDDYDYTDKKYIPTKDEFLRYVAYMRHLGMELKKLSKDSDKMDSKQIEQFDEMINFNRSYEEHLEYLKTNEAKRIHTESRSNRTLQVISKDIDNLTEEEHMDAYEKVEDVFYGRLYKKLIVSDETDTVEITKDKYDGLVRLFSTQEIKTLLSKPSNENSNFNVHREEVPFSIIDTAPTLIECSEITDNIERKSCLSDFINKFVNKNFNTGIAEELTPGRKRIFVQFKIDEEGNVKNILARGPSKKLEIEAKRVIAMLPQFIPGKQKGKLVTVPYSLPIVFQVAGTRSKVDELVAQRDRILKNSSEKNPVVIQLNRQIEDLRKEMKTDSNTPKYDKFIKDVEQNTINDKVISFSNVDLVPAFTDCELITDNEQRKKCTSKGVSKFVNQNFDTEMASKIGINGRQKIFVNFVVNTQGEVVNIKARASHPKLENEASRVIKALPKFMPGKHDGVEVEVSYSLPIIFQVASSKKD
ncbi:energy transducer TonB [Winogradskyella sp. PE311]|uniref:energy transducer TonB n=1 Tax=Winogradskyella sp. PE311 TaxID=3366943 RepID=UPI00397ECEF4